MERSQKMTGMVLEIKTLLLFASTYLHYYAIILFLYQWHKMVLK